MLYRLVLGYIGKVLTLVSSEYQTIFASQSYMTKHINLIYISTAAYSIQNKLKISTYVTCVLGTFMYLLKIALITELVIVISLETYAALPCPSVLRIRP